MQQGKFRVIISVLSFLIILISRPSKGQYVRDEIRRSEDDRESEHRSKTTRQRISVGGNIGLSFGEATYVDISPLVGYNFTSRIVGGIGGTYIYFKPNQLPATTNIGGRLFTRYRVYDNAFLHGEFESISFEYYTTDAMGRTITKHNWVSSPIVGGGYYVPISPRANFMVMGLFILNYDKNRSPYSSPFIFRAGFMF